MITVVEAATTTAIASAEQMILPTAEAVIVVRIAANEIVAGAAMLVAAEGLVMKKTGVVITSLVRAIDGMRAPVRKCDAGIAGIEMMGHQRLVQLLPLPSKVRMKIEIGHPPPWVPLHHRRHLLILHHCPMTRVGAAGILPEIETTDLRIETAKESVVATEAGIVITIAMEIVIASVVLLTRTTMQVLMELLVVNAWEATAKDLAADNECNRCLSD